MTEPIVIVHGWSDESDSFNALAEFIRASMGAEPVVIRLADWISMRNSVNFQDLAFAMQQAWDGNKLPRTPRSTNVIVHSTGALVVREWMVTYYQPATVPIKRFVMLAPANFGSHLAHKGRSFLGRALKGWAEPNFETGEQVLRGLELGSPYTYALASKDLFSTARWYGKDRILATVLVGNTGYSGVAAIANETGSDGTVRISTANLNCARLTAALDEKQQLIDKLRLEHSKGAIAFGIVDKENHSTLAFKDKGPKNPLARDLIQKALRVTDDDYSETGADFPWQREIVSKDPAVLTGKDRRQTTVVYVRDNLGNEVQDYFVEFYRTTDDDKRFEKRLYEKAVESVHSYAANPAFRALNVNTVELDALLAQATTRELYVSILANPRYAPPNSPVGYVPLAMSEVSGIRITPDRSGEFFSPHRTLLVGLTLHRKVDSSVFSIR